MQALQDTPQRPFVQHNASQAYNIVKPRPLETLRQNSQGTDPGYGCPTVTGQKGFQQPSKVQVERHPWYQTNGEGQKEPPICQFTRQIRRY